MLITDAQRSIMEWISIMQVGYSGLLENWITKPFKNWYIKRDLNTEKFKCFQVLCYRQLIIRFQIFTCITESLIPSFTSSNYFTLKAVCPEALRIYLILPLYHGFANPLNCTVLHTPFCKAILSLKPEILEIITSWWLGASTHYFERLVRIHKSIVLYYVKSKQSKINKVTIIDKRKLSNVFFDIMLQML